MSTQLTRSTHGRPAAPVRILHVGLGNFMRAHQAWYTEKASNADEWGIAAFTGRRPLMAELLTPQDGLYTLITKEAAGNSYEVISSIVAVHPASDFASFIGYFESSDLSIVTSTVTEVGYCRRPDGSLDLEDAGVAADLDALKELVGKETELGSAELSTAPAKILAGLLARRAAGIGPLTILPCDNLPDNGSAFARVVTDAAREVDPSIVQWMDENVSWATCMVDRITPATSDADRDECEKVQGYTDASPVPTEPFSEWVISGDFPAGRPDWEVAGAQIVEDVEPYEQRKLWMLNGSHSLMAYAAPILGHETVADAIGDQVVRGWVQKWWEEAGSGLQVEWEDYAAALLARYENPNIRHLLAQIAHDGSQKIPVRIAPTLINQRTQGKLPVSAVKAVAAWMLHLQGYGAPVVDKNADKVASQLNDNATKNAEVVLNYVAPELSGDAELVTAIADAAEEILSFAKE